jgi:hypothetical protein
MAHLTCARESFNVRYQCPETGAEKFEISPTSHTMPISFSSKSRTSELSLETVYIFWFGEEGWEPKIDDEDKSNSGGVSMEISGNIIHIKGWNAN